MPPYTLPANANMMVLKSNTTKGGGGYNEIVLVEGKAGELIRVHAQKDRDTTSQGMFQLECAPLRFEKNRGELKNRTRNSQKSDAA